MLAARSSTAQRSTATARSGQVRSGQVRSAGGSAGGAGRGGADVADSLVLAVTGNAEYLTPVIAIGTGALAAGGTVHIRIRIRR
ncbi:hypothetical protein ACFRAI_22235 [Streptomyces sp. NPDC056637]|uniref:hypothetical protein n=1 Tax=unclassified Streptomyces TaxID=2593676 RepID=UPI0036976799